MRFLLLVGLIVVSAYAEKCWDYSNGFPSDGKGIFGDGTNAEQDVTVVNNAATLTSGTVTGPAPCSSGSSRHHWYNNGNDCLDNSNLGMCSQSDYYYDPVNYCVPRCPGATYNSAYDACCPSSGTCSDPGPLTSTTSNSAGPVYYLWDKKANDGNGGNIDLAAGSFVSVNVTLALEHKATTVSGQTTSPFDFELELDSTSGSSFEINRDDVGSATWTLTLNLPSQSPAPVTFTSSSNKIYIWIILTKDKKYYVYASGTSTRGATPTMNGDLPGSLTQIGMKPSVQQKAVAGTTIYKASLCYVAAPSTAPATPITPAPKQTTITVKFSNNYGGEVFIPANVADTGITFKLDSNDNNRYKGRTLVVTRIPYYSNPELLLCDVNAVQVYAKSTSTDGVSWSFASSTFKFGNVKYYFYLAPLNTGSSPCLDRTKLSRPPLTTSVAQAALPVQAP